jgi:hypothetical protein
MHGTGRALAVAVALHLLAAGAAVAQVGVRAERTLGGFWLHAEWGVGAAWIDCAACPGERLERDPWEGGSGWATGLAAGGTPAPNLEVGGEFGYFRTWRREGRISEMSTVALVLRYYPLAASPLSVRGGVGLGTLDLSATGAPPLASVTEQSVALRAGVAYELRLMRAYALVPAAGVTWIVTGGGVTARHPSYVQLVIGLTRY